MYGLPGAECLFVAGSRIFHIDRSARYRSSRGFLHPATHVHAAVDDHPDAVPDAGTNAHAAAAAPGMS
jgi:hypothetical protein